MKRQYIADEKLDLVLDKLCFNRIKSLNITNATQKVFDLEIENYPNYITEVGLAHNGGGKRKGSFAIYLEPWHADIFGFLDLKRNQGKDEVRARDLFYALWVPDLFMQRVKDDGDWTLFDPNTTPGLSDCWGDEFNELYTKYETENKGIRTVKAQDLWKKILEIQVETSMPYILYKDACNGKSNQQNLGTIKSSNLCSEIVEYTAPDEIAVCNLASISLPSYVEGQTRMRFNHKKLYEMVKTVTKNLNKVIDVNHYPLPEAKNSNMRHRPVGLGVQGLADVFMKMRYTWDSFEAFKLNREIFETIYFASIEASAEEAEQAGAYSTFKGSPASEGRLQFDLWFENRIKNGLVLNDYEKKLSGDSPTNGQELYCTSGRYDWAALRKKILDTGLRNSLNLSLMPTASTANILGNTEGFEPIPSNIYKRNVLSGEFVRINKYLVEDLQELNLWNDEMKQKIVAGEGSIQYIKEIPEKIRELYKTVWEIKQRYIIDLSADRGAFICQSQSLNIYMAKPTYGKLTSMHFYGWQKGLKTGSYYIRQQAARQAQKFTVDPTIEKQRLDAQESEQPTIETAFQILKDKGYSPQELESMSEEEIIILAKGNCSLDNPDDCIMCSG